MDHPDKSTVESPTHSTWATRRKPIGPVDLIVTDPEEAANALARLAQKATCGWHVHLLNAYSVALADKDPAFAAALQGDALNLPDGKPLSWVSRFRRDSPPLRQVRGPQLFLDLFDVGRQSDLKHFLLGSTNEVLEKLQSNLLRAFPGAQIVGTHSPPFRALSEAELAEQDTEIRSSGAQVVWVGLGTPKQDFEAKRIAASLDVVAVAVGAAFDFAAGSVKEAPHWMTRVGLEWAYRFAVEPRRLWRRYVFGNIRFLKVAVSGPRIR